jgi:hypothetical protein
VVFVERCSESAWGLEEHWYATRRNHGRVRGDTILENGSERWHDFQTLSNVRVEVDAITEKLQADG